jgi:hypothetical protein
MQLQYNESTAKHETWAGTGVWIYKTWANPDWFCKITRQICAGSESRYSIEISPAPIPSHELNVLMGKIATITFGGRE